MQPAIIVPVPDAPDEDNIGEVLDAEKAGGDVPTDEEAPIVNKAGSAPPGVVPAPPEAPDPPIVNISGDVLAEKVGCPVPHEGAVPINEAGSAPPGAAPLGPKSPPAASASAAIEAAAKGIYFKHY